MSEKNPGELTEISLGSELIGSINSTYRNTIAEITDAKNILKEVLDADEIEQGWEPVSPETWKKAISILCDMSKRLCELGYEDRGLSICSYPEAAVDFHWNGKRINRKEIGEIGNRHASLLVRVFSDRIVYIGSVWFYDGKSPLDSESNTISGMFDIEGKGSGSFLANVYQILVFLVENQK